MLPAATQAAQAVLPSSGVCSSTCSSPSLSSSNYFDRPYGPAGSACSSPSLSNSNSSSSTDNACSGHSSAGEHIASCDSDVETHSAGRSKSCGGDTCPPNDAGGSASDTLSGLGPGSANSSISRPTCNVFT